MEKEVNSELVVNTLILSHLLRDNLQLLSEAGLATGKLKVARNQFHIQLDRYLAKSYSNVTGDLAWLSDQIDVSWKLLDTVFKTDMESKQELLHDLESRVCAEEV